MLKTNKTPNALNPKNPMPPTKNKPFGNTIATIIPINKSQNANLIVAFKSFHRI